MFSICLKIQLFFCSPKGTIPPFFIEMVSSGITFLRLISFVIPKPLQASQAPFGELKEKVFGSGFGYAIPVVGHINSLLKYLASLSSTAITIKILLPEYKAVFIVSSKRFSTDSFMANRSITTSISCIL